jgi:hypothetical protein
MSCRQSFIPACAASSDIDEVKRAAEQVARIAAAEEDAGDYIRHSAYEPSTN